MPRDKPGIDITVDMGRRGSHREAQQQRRDAGRADGVRCVCADGQEHRFRGLDEQVGERGYHNRRAIHADPELSFQEERTAQKLERALAAVGEVDARRVAKTGVVARVRGRDRSAPIVAIRGDIDALPVREETDLLPSHNRA